MKRTRKITAADLFCGAGGTSTGLMAACQELGADLHLTAINHWDVAIQTHTANHPDATHLCESLDNVDPRKLVPSGRLNLLVASPECTHHSNARGGKPMSDQSRASAWHILRWAEALYIDNILVENVREFQNWGPIGANGRPLASKRGQTFQAFLDSLRSLGYAVDWRILNAADYGDATTRERLFIQARRGNKRISWPEPTHGPRAASQAEMFAQRKPWRTAREIIDWSIPGTSIFDRKKPLAPATIERIAAGLRKFGGRNADPFLVVLRRHADARSVDDPLPTVTAGGQHFGVCEPFVIGAGGPIGKGRNPQSVDQPLTTVLTENHMALVEPFVIGQQSGATPRAVDEPLPTVATKGAIALVEPFLVPFNGNRERDLDRARSTDEPLPTVTAGGNRFGLCEPFVVEMRGGKTANSIDQPLSTVTTKGAHHAIVEPFVLSMEHGQKPDSFVMPVNHGKDDRTYPLDRPMPTITTVDAWAVVEPFVVEYYGTADARPVAEPLATVTTKDRFGLVEVDGAQIDIRFRMLQPHELAAAMGFPADYKFSGNRELKVKQIGNAVCVNLAAALCKEMVA